MTVCTTTTLFHICSICLHFIKTETGTSGNGTDGSPQLPRATEQEVPSNVDDIDGATASETLSQDDKLFTLCLLHGGMDTEGEVFDDMLVINLEN